MQLSCQGENAFETLGFGYPSSILERRTFQFAENLSRMSDLQEISELIVGRSGASSPPFWEGGRILKYAMKEESGFLWGIISTRRQRFPILFVKSHSNP